LVLPAVDDSYKLPRNSRPLARTSRCNLFHITTAIKWSTLPPSRVFSPPLSPVHNSLPICTSR
jgi:hypothetical protein